MFWAAVGLGVLTSPLPFTLCVFAWAMVYSGDPYRPSRIRDVGFWTLFSVVWIGWVAWIFTASPG